MYSSAFIINIIMVCACECGGVFVHELNGFLNVSQHS